MNQSVVGTAAPRLIVALLAGIHVGACGSEQSDGDVMEPPAGDALGSTDGREATQPPSTSRPAEEDAATHIRGTVDVGLGSPANEVVVDGVFTFRWDSSSADGLHFEMSAPTSGWLAVGFGPSVAMAGANVLIGFVDDGGVQVRDDWGNGPFSHVADTSYATGTSDVLAATGSWSPATATSPASTTIALLIPWESADTYDKPLAPGQTVKAIFAHGANGANDFTSYHVWRGKADIDL